MKFHSLVVSAMAIAAVPATAQAALTIATNADIGAGIASFGSAQRLLDWTGGFGPGSSWTHGSYGGAISNSGSFTDAVTGSTATGNLSITNWLDGTGFDKAGSAAPDLAISGPENFLLSFTGPVNRVGFAVATGLSLLPSEISAASTSFTLLTSADDSALLTLVNPGNGLSVWVDVQSATPFTSLRFTETGGDLTDQYFGNFVSGTVPEPAVWAMFVLGMGAIGAVLRRRRPGQHAVSA